MVMSTLPSEENSRARAAVDAPGTLPTNVPDKARTLRGVKQKMIKTRAVTSRSPLLVYAAHDSGRVNEAHTYI